jgi:radical SAM protein with 4Fe4S-binding SPASM domain
MSGPGCRHSLQRGIATDLIEQGAKLGASRVSFGGGEPTAATGFIDALHRAVSLGMHAEVFTCGVAQNGEGLAALPCETVKTIAALENVKLIFSFHGPNAAVHDSVSTGLGSFDRLVESIKACLAAGIPCEANFVPMRPNAASFGEVLDSCVDQGLRRMSVLRFVPQGRGLENREELELSREDEDAFLAELVRCRSSGKVAIRTGSPFNGLVKGNHVPCRAGSSKLVVQPDGNVIPCEVFKHEGRRNWQLSVYDATLEECLESAQFIDLRNRLAKSNSLACPVHSTLRARRNGGTADGSGIAVAI